MYDCMTLFRPLFRRDVYYLGEYTHEAGRGVPCRADEVRPRICSM